MKLGKVVGKLSLVKAHPSLTGRRWVIAMPQSLSVLAGQGRETEEEVIVVDELGATAGSLIGISDGREAAAPFEPQRKPVDAYVACLVDELRIDAVETKKLLRSR
jgi:ethanolamine utilization protein EutN